MTDYFNFCIISLPKTIESSPNATTAQNTQNHTKIHQTSIHQTPSHQTKIHQNSTQTKKHVSSQNSTAQNLSSQNTTTAEKTKKQILKGKQLAGSSAKQRAKRSSEAPEDKYITAAALDII